MTTATHMYMNVVPVLVLTGPVGVGKTSVARVVSDLLTEGDVPHAMIDLDWLRWCVPSPPGDPFHTALGLQNLTTVWAQYQAAGATRLILVDVVETRAMLTAYQAAVQQAAITIVRLHASVATLHSRLVGREIGASLDWHQVRATELAVQMEHDAVEDVRIDTEGKAIVDVAREVLKQIQWLNSVMRRRD